MIVRLPFPNPNNPHMLPKVRSEALRRAVAQMPCCLRISSMIPGYACSGQDTVVGCHIASIGRGVSTKGSDLGIVAGCQHCHDLLDPARDSRGLKLMELYPAAVLQRVIDGWMQTMHLWVQMGLLTGEDWELTK